MFIEKDQQVKYEIIEQIGQGSFATCYKCISNNQNDQKQYCLKVIEYDILQPQQQQIITEETKIHKLLSEQSKYIIQYYDSFFTTYQNQKVYVVVMELGIMSLDKFINDELTKKFDQLTLLTCFLDIANAVYIVHKNQYIHRDIACKNILLIEDEHKDITMKLCDFGTCKLEQECQNQKEEVGTLLTMAPEVLNQQQSICQSDMWSIGCELWKDSNPLQLVQSMNKYKELNIDQQLLQQVNQNYSKLFLDRIIKILKQLLEKDPQKRQTAEQLINQLVKLRHIVKSEEELTQYFESKPIQIDFDKNENRFIIENISQQQLKKNYSIPQTPRTSQFKSQKDFKQNFNVEIYTGVPDSIL